TEFLTTKGKDGSSEPHLRTLKYHLEGFGNHFTGLISSVKPSQIHDWLLGLPVAARTRVNFLITLSNFFGFARLRGYGPKSANLIADVPRPRPTRHAVEIYTVEEL